MNSLLVEIGCEDLPASSIRPMAEHLGQRLQLCLSEAGLLSADAVAGKSEPGSTDHEPQVFATPRRIAALIPDVRGSQAEREQTRRGPSLAAAYDDAGQPSKALQGFLRSADADASQLGTLETDKGSWVVLRQSVAGLTLSEVLSDAIPEILRTLPVPRRMRWGDSDAEFLRPVEWLVALHGAAVLPLHLLGLAAGRETRGHRFHAPGVLSLDTACDYPDVLTSHYVRPDFCRRRAIITEQVTATAARLGGQALMPDELLDEVTALVEWPVALGGHFDDVFLELPKEALIQTMQDNQRYFAVLDSSGELMPAFVTVANLESRQPQVVIDGNERVIRPRLADTMFFWNQDKAHRLQALVPQLDSVQFQQALGSVGDKVQRITRLAATLSPGLDANRHEAIQAAQLCKADLVSEIVRELPGMQGIAGRYYARRDGLPEAVCNAMEQHYFPKQAGGALPEGAVSQCVALADKADTLVGVFGIGMLPTGTRDPYALRRAALGVVRILIECEHDLDLAALYAAAASGYSMIDNTGSVAATTAAAGAAGAHRLTHDNVPELVHFTLERVRTYLLEQGVAGDTLDAVLARAPARPLDIYRRCVAVGEFRSGDAAASLSAASKRAANLLRKVEHDMPELIDTALFDSAAEAALFSRLEELTPASGATLVQGTATVEYYQQAMTELAGLRDAVDRFFSDVMVMVDEPATRHNRLALLARLHAACTTVADVSLLQDHHS